jgi:hypothetical protein
MRVFASAISHSLGVPMKSCLMRASASAAIGALPPM